MRLSFGFAFILLITTDIKIQEQRFLLAFAPLSTIRKQTCQHPGQEHALTSHRCLSSSFFIRVVSGLSSRPLLLFLLLPTQYCCTLGIHPSCTDMMRVIWPDLWGTLIKESDRLLAVSVVNTGGQTSSKSEDQCQMESQVVFNAASITGGSQCFISLASRQNLNLTFSSNLLQTSVACSSFKLQTTVSLQVFFLAFLMSSSNIIRKGNLIILYLSPPPPQMQRSAFQSQMMKSGAKAVSGVFWPNPTYECLLEWEENKTARGSPRRRLTRPRTGIWPTF